MDDKTKKGINQGRKFAQVTVGATEVFLRDGYAGASVDDIAQAGRVSKATLYSYFPYKALMFDEAMRTELGRVSRRNPFSENITDGPHLALRRITRQIADWLMDPDHLRLHSVHMAEAERFPEIAARYRAVLRDLIYDRLQRRLDAWVAHGQLKIDDTHLAARQLVAMAMADLHETALLNVDAKMQHDHVDRVTQSAAAMFLMAYQTDAVDKGVSRNNADLIRTDIRHPSSLG